MCVYTYIYVYMCVYLYIYTHICVYLYISIYIYLYTKKRLGMTKFGVSPCWIQPHVLPNLTMFSGCTRLLQRHGQGRYCHGDLVTMLHV